VAGETAARVLALLGVEEGETLLVHGAAGVVGSVGVQLAVAAGVTVIGTASEADHAYLREPGAIPVTYGEGLADRVRTAAPGGVDAVFDAAGHDTLPVSIELVGRGARTASSRSRRRTRRSTASSSAVSPRRPRWSARG
jgi:NADPH:quinone reductase-like Zn-dependent oxidoreductase